ncbi:hypothetical protein N7444_007058, partial [Penicillium canescens]
YLEKRNQVVNVAATGLTIRNSIDHTLIPRTGEVKYLLNFESEASGNQSAKEYPLPTEREHQTLRKVVGTLPLFSFSLCLVEFAERASYCGTKTVFPNFIQFSLPEGSTQRYGAGASPRGTYQTAGALGMGLQAISGLVLLFSFLVYVIPIFGGWRADVYVGQYKAIIVEVLTCALAHIIQVIGAIASILQKGPANAASPFILGLILLAFGAGIFKPDVSPTILVQQRQKTAYTKKLKSGETVIVDPEAITIRTLLIFYGFINIGALFMLATTYAEILVVIFADRSHLSVAPSSSGSCL